MEQITQTMSDLTVKGLDFATGWADINYKTNADRKNSIKSRKFY